MNANKKKWQSLLKKCQGIINTFDKSRAIAQTREQLSSSSPELLNEAKTFCAKYGGLQRGNPGPGCSGDNSPASLYEEAAKISHLINPNILQDLDAYQQVCDGLNNEESDTDEEEIPSLITLCDKKQLEFY